MNRTRTREPLTRDRIVEAALRVADSEGLEAVTMRRLGRELGVEAMSLYNHVEGKEAVLTGVLERVMAEFDVPEPDGQDWVARIREMSRRFRRLLLRHPGAIPLLSERTGPMTDPRALRPIEVALETLRGAGLSDEETIHAYRAVVGFIVGSVMLEVAGFMNPEETGWAHVEEMLEVIRVEQFPHLVELLPAMKDCDADSEFEHGLALLLTGLEARSVGRHIGHAR